MGRWTRAESPTYRAPREAPRPPPSFPAPPSSPSPSRLGGGLEPGNSHFRSLRAPRAPSIRSFEASVRSFTPTTVDDGDNAHTYAMHNAPLPVVSSQDNDEEDECPVCLEPLSFSFRLPGEKPHIVPECGHALHEACFTAVYGPPPSQVRGVPRKSNLGVCGVCRRPMKVGDGDGGKSNKLATLTGMGERNVANLFPGRDTPTGGRRGTNTSSKPFDPTEDDPLEHAGSVKSQGDSSPYVVAPSIQIRPEFSSLTRTNDPSQPLTCIILIELPGKRATSGAAVPGPLVTDSYAHPHPPRQQRQQPPIRRELSPAPPPPPPPEDNPFSAITEDLRNRITDWKGHPLSDLGPLQMYDLLTVRRDNVVREFYVYLFKEALICVVEEKKRSLGRLLSDPSIMSSSSANTSSMSSKGVLRLKGRIYVRHIKQVTATSAAGEMSLTIDMEDELASFILIFKDRGSLEAWRARVESLVKMFQRQSGTSRSNEGEQLNMEEFGGSSKAMRMLSGGSSHTNGSTVSSGTMDSLLGSTSRSSSTSHGSGYHGGSIHGGKLSTLGEDDELYESASATANSPTGLVTPYTSQGPSNSLTPLPHPPLDLILVISVPPPGSPTSTAQLKCRVIRSTLEFMMANLGKKDRISFVTFEVGMGGRVRKTPFLSVGRATSKKRLENFVEGVVFGRIAGDEAGTPTDEFLIRGPKDEKTDVVTAVNHGLDVVLQRKSKNPVSGMLLVSDAADSTRRAQMDLVLARAEAANVPIHSFGYGRSHDPASLWLMSNHTSGTYTFVKDWYDLRDCIAGCVGGMMSIGLLNMKLHMRIVDQQRFRIRKVSGGPSSILASDGMHVDVDVGELRYGERKEMLIELELDNADMQAKRAAMARGANRRALNATDQFVQSMGLDALSIDDAPDFADGMMDRMIDEVPVVEVDGSFFDPAAVKHVSRLAHPVLLTITLLPAPSDGSAPHASGGVSDPVIVRRRMELLASDMITRALVLVSRRNFPQAQKILGETKRILHTVLQTISRALPPPNANGSTVRNRKEILTLAAVRAMQAILQDLQILTEALEDNVELFAHDQRNFGAQQAMILRDQKSWSGRSATERLFWTTDNSIELVSRSADWVAKD
ncbi:Pleckstrin homology domain-containing protein [Schizophyllum amplum]|uniref:Pleckstrin homology domain-containing protein n=1 Tax=Schizophyllum amplum TaxID=97359 RepID=A0A550CL61_9AGAR|nr:Pleckstrin homology domain-containing protein [Auriculariopsis ampla]